MSHIPALRTAAIAVAITFSAESPALEQGAWQLDTRGASGPIAQVKLADAGGKRRTSFIAFEYARRCDPIFSFAEITGSRLGTPLAQSVLAGTKIGVIVNGRYHTWHAATTKYDNGYEAGFGVTNDLFELLVGEVHTLAFVTPNGEQVPMPTRGFRKSVQEASAACAKRFK